MSLARASCRLSFAARLAACPAAFPTTVTTNPSPDAVRSRHPSNSTLAHDAVAAEVLYKHHSIICVGEGLLRFVHGAHSRLATEATRNRNPYSPFLARVFTGPTWQGNAQSRRQYLIGNDPSALLSTSKGPMCLLPHNSNACLHIVRSYETMYKAPYPPLLCTDRIHTRMRVCSYF